MDNIIYKKAIIPKEEDLLELYKDANWTSYTRDLSHLVAAIKNSLLTITAWDGDKLAGLIRVVGDGVSIIYIQDILVLKSCQRKGIGTHLVNAVLEEYKQVRQKVLLTDDTPLTRGFYEALGFLPSDKGRLVSYFKFE